MEDYRIYRMAEDVKVALDRLVKRVSSEIEQYEWRANRVEEDRRYNQSQVSGYEDQIDRLQEECSRLRSEIKHLQLESPSPDIRREPEPRISSSPEAELLRKENQRLRNTLEGLESRASTAERRVRELESSSRVSSLDNSTKEELAKIREENNRLSTQLRTAQEEAKVNKEETRRLQASLQRSDTSVGELSAVRDSLAHAEKTAASLRESFDAEKVRADKLEASAREYYERMNAAESKVTELEAALKEATGKLADCDPSQVSHMKTLIEQLNRDKAEIQKRWKDEEEKVTNLKVKLDNTRRELDGRVLMVRDRDSKLKDAESRILVGANSLRDALYKNQSLRVRLQELQEKLDARDKPAPEDDPEEKAEATEADSAESSESGESSGVSTQEQETDKESAKQKSTDDAKVEKKSKATAKKPRSSVTTTTNGSGESVDEAGTSPSKSPAKKASPRKPSAKKSKETK